jgi:DNA polymerase elongation subunit (family B)
MIKHDYRTQYPDAISAYNVAMLDIETDMIHGTQKPIMSTVVYRNEVVTFVLKSFVSGFVDPVKAIDECMDKYLSEYIEKRNIVATTVLVETELELVDKSFKQLHEWQPDILAIWNMDFDIPKMIEVCVDAGVDPKWIFSDPRVPDEFKSFRYKQGQKKRVSAAGKVFPINPANQWHVVYTPASFWILDAMCVYRLLRLAKGEERSYALDYILNKVLGIRKLKFKEADGHIADKWHIFMQTYYKIEYIIYNRFDCISMQELDEKTKDLSNTLPDYAGCTDFDVFNSQPKRIATDYHYYLLENGEVLAAKGVVEQYVPEEPEPSDTDENGELIDDEGDETLDVIPVKEDRVLSLKGWIVTLPSSNVVDNGLRCLLEDVNLHTNARGHVYDSDCVSSYPSDIMAMNVSKATTVREIITIEGVEEYTFRMQNINIMSGHTNALEYCTTMFNFPTPEKMLEMYTSQR